MNLLSGMRVKCQRDAPSRGTWPRYEGRYGMLVVTDNDGEMGVQLDGAKARHLTWFLPSELVSVRPR